ncbi:T-cell surface glycoprotein CD3 zeta chain-like isoform X2 [Micropterus salmoides]|uniref:T-cell surface glycoprotein CD3 zeta chain-like isoform X2 n=1 Tax=Micropterus salmoides TaxID=27706 RepID=UPI0018EA712D|nr:T-cell surface glycoprotein CD3 zeta chain-like isoform X2 [Micropterus salmoides]XP_045910103.1 T-cell surface glycoprotein CD3 zeta chain-like isoform X2 [Micropterus dolomieu]
MDALRTGVFVLFVLLEPVSCKEVFFTAPVICYFLDGILMIYCIVATVFFFREKYFYNPPLAVGVSAENGAIYQELDRPKDADPYQMLEPVKGKKKAGKKIKPELTLDSERDKDPYESLVLTATSPPLSPR